MYVFLINDDNTITASKKERIMQRSKLVDELWFLTCPTYKGYDMSKCTVLLEYILPVSKKYCSEILTLSEEGYEDHLKYLLPFDTNLTAEAGKIELQITFILSDLDADGNSIQRVRKTSTAFVNVIPIAAWSDVIPDGALSAIDQRIIKIDSQINALSDTANVINQSKADNIKYDSEESTLQLMSGAKEIGNKVKLEPCVTEEGVPVVSFGDESDGDNPDSSTPSDDVIEF